MNSLLITDDRSVFIMFNGSPVEIDPDEGLAEKIKNLAPGEYDADDLDTTTTSAEKRDLSFCKSFFDGEEIFAKFDEWKHPRDEHGRWTSSGSSTPAQDLFAKN